MIQEICVKINLFLSFKLVSKNMLPFPVHQVGVKLVS